MRTFIALLANLLFALLAIGSMAVLVFGSSESNALQVIRQPDYLKSPRFESRVSESLDAVFNYIDLSEVFETRGNLDLRKVIAQAETNGVAVSYSLEYLVSYARSMGYYLNERNEIMEDGPASVSRQQDERDHPIRVTYRAYMPDYQPASPADGLTSLGGLAREMLGYLADYYRVRAELIDQPTNLKFYISFYTKDSKTVYGNDDALHTEDITSLGRYIATDSWTLELRSNMQNPPPNVVPMLAARNPYHGGFYDFAVGIDTGFPEKDAYALDARNYAERHRDALVFTILLAAGILGMAISFVLSLRFAGEAAGQAGEDLAGGDSGLVRLHPVDRLPLEVQAGLLLLWRQFVLVLVPHLLFSTERVMGVLEGRWFWRSALSFLLQYMLFVPVCLSIARNYKAGTLWHSSLFRRVCAVIRESVQSASLTAPRLFSYAFFLVPNLVGLCSLAGLLLYFLQANSLRAFLASAAILAILLAMDYYTWRIAGGLKEAVAEQVRAERLKTDLITNVSHDLKTPLTSIINYVDLMKREKIENEKALEYLDILEQKSQRLKTLTEDLVEASKASSGNVEMEFMELDYGEMVQQALGEFEDRFLSCQLEIVPDLPSSPAMIVADGRRLWRVLENLLNNVCKYALSGSRVYVDLAEDGEMFSCVIKNISSRPLNISPEELTERFVRGDVSRTTEGSGLGLSIAKSLTGLMKGELRIQIDGDLYKASVRLPKAPLKGDGRDKKERPEGAGGQPRKGRKTATFAILSFLLALALPCTGLPRCGGTGAVYGEELPWPVLSQVIQSEGAILIEAGSGTVLYQKNEHTHYYPASITKVLTAVVVLENVENLDEKLVFSNDAVNTNLESNSTIIGAVAGDQLSVRDCLYCLLLHSANDCANALAEHVAGSNQAFAEMMNAKAAELGCTDSHFANPSGLNNPEHYTSCADMAKIMQYAIRDPRFCQIESSAVYTHGPLRRYPADDAPENTIYAHHRMLRRSYREYYEGAFAGKTGYTILAGNTLVTACERNGMTLICVILNGHNSQYTDTKALFDFGFEQFHSISASGSGIGEISLESHLAVESIPLVDMLEFSIDERDCITLPQGADVSIVQTALTYDIPEEERAEGGFARLAYFYGERAVGVAHIRLLMPENDLSWYKKEADAGGLPGMPEESVLESIDVAGYGEAGTKEEGQWVQAMESRQSNAPLIFDREQGRIILQQPVRRVLIVLLILVLLIPAGLFAFFLVDKIAERRRRRRRSKLLRQTRDLSPGQKSTRDLLLNRRMNLRKRKLFGHR